MKFNDEARLRFKKELQQFAIAQEKKYGVKISFLSRENEPNYFGIRVKEAPQSKYDDEDDEPIPNIIPRKPQIKRPEPAPAPKKKDALDELNDLDIDSLDFSDLKEEKPAPRKPEVKKSAPKKDELDELDNLDIDSLDFSDLKEEKPAPKKKDALDELDDLDIDSLDFSDLGDEEGFVDKGNKKKDELDELDDLDIDSLDFSDLEEEKPAPKPKKKPSREDDEDRYSQELEKYLGSSSYKKSSFDEEPDNIFDEKELDDDISEEEIDAYLASSGRYSYSFQAKLIQSDNEIQDYYTDVKNLLLSYDGVKSKVGWDYDAFIYKGREIARIDIEDGLLNLYLKLDANDYLGSYDNAINHNNPKFKDTKLLYSIATIADVDGAYELIDDLATENHIYPGEDRYDDYHFEYETNDELIARGLIKKN